MQHLPGMTLSTCCACYVCSNRSVGYLAVRQPLVHDLTTPCVCTCVLLLYQGVIACLPSAYEGATAHCFSLLFCMSGYSVLLCVRVRLPCSELPEGCDCPFVLVLSAVLDCPARLAAQFVCCAQSAA